MLSGVFTFYPAINVLFQIVGIRLFCETGHMSVNFAIFVLPSLGENDLILLKQMRTVDLLKI
jgi:hypothetical protein